MTLQPSTISVFAPISIGNISVGFDNLGMALIPTDGTLLGDIVHITEGENSENTLTCIGDYKSILPENPQDNIVWQCQVEFDKRYKKSGKTPKILDITLEKNIPICSGLGSSACSVVAGLNALNEFYNNHFDQNELLKIMGELEAKISGSLHYDNVAPCYLGGLQLMLDEESSKLSKVCQGLPIFEDCYWVISYPDIKISTKMAREILPESYSKETLIITAKRFASFVDASYRKDQVQAFSNLKDLVAEPYRIPLLPNFKLTKDALEKNGCLAVGISGSGPTMFAACADLDVATKAQHIFEDLYCDSNRQCFTHICKTDIQGSRRV